MSRLSKITPATDDRLTRALAAVEVAFGKPVASARNQNPFERERSMAGYLSRPVGSTDEEEHGLSFAQLGLSK